MENHRKIILVILLVATAGATLGYIFINPEIFGICEQNDRNCIFPRAFIWGEPLLFGLAPLSLPLLLLLIMPKQVFNLWWKWAVVLVPLGVVWITVTPVICGSLICYNKDMVTWISSTAFVIVSFIIIVYKSIRLYLKKKKTASQ